MPERKDDSIYSRLGKRRVIKIVWYAIPLQFRLLAFPYCLSVYSRFLAQSSSISEVRVLHSALYSDSRLFKICRPRFHVIKQALLSLDIKVDDQAAHREATMACSVPPTSSEQMPVSIRSVTVPQKSEYEGERA